MRIDAVVTDLDGTFWASDMSVHPVTTGVVDALDRRGVPLVIATGRRARSAMVGLDAAGLADRPAILMNGALVREQLRGESFLVECIASDDALAVHDAFARSDLEPVAYVDHPENDMLIGSRPAAGSDYVSSAPGIRQVADLTVELGRHPVIGFGAFGFDRRLLQPVADAINAAGWATAIIGTSIVEGGSSLMVQGAGIDKQTGIEAWCQRTGVDPSRLAVLGDAGNDELMLRGAAVAIVPSNAPIDILELADHVIPPAEEGGWAGLHSILGL